MKKRLNLILIFCIVVNTFLFLSCFETEKGTEPLRPNLSNEIFAIVSPPQNRPLRNFVVLTTDAEQKIILNITELSQNRIIILSQGKYEFRADGIENSVFDFGKDCKITISPNGRTFIQNDLLEPPRISFRGSRWDMKGPLLEDARYFLAILDLDNLNETGEYTATISGVGDIPLNPTKENNRILSMTTHSFKRGTYTVNVSVNGVSRFEPFEFRVVPPDPKPIVIKNTWGKEGKPLQYANMHIYKVPANVTSPGSVMPRNDDGTGRESFNSFDYKNNDNIISINGQRLSNIGDKGEIILPKVNPGDRFILIAMGVTSGSDVYTHTLSVDNTVWNRSGTTILWDKIPSKGDNFVVNVPVDRYSLDSWAKIDDFSVFFYYQVGNPATIPGQAVLESLGRDNGFARANVADFRRETEDSIMSFVDLSNISSVSHFNYLLQVRDASMGTFVMNNTSDEISLVPQPLRKEAGVK